MQLNDVIDAIVMKLHNRFGDEYPIHTEGESESIEGPAFFMAPLEITVTKRMGNRYFVTLPFDIRYFASGNREAYAILARLWTEMEFITCPNGDLLRGTKISARIENGALHFFINYDYHILKVMEPEDAMQGLSVEGSIRGE
ncbi:DUF6838 family protein [Robertmurraya sp. FSL W8-0741]|uniref:phage tail terminator family protein n=1 Tax=Robertmurraya sp. FSL W8-0741 TaxID=2954629 RepID=UPI0030F56FE2